MFKRKILLMLTVLGTCLSMSAYANGPSNIGANKKHKAIYSINHSNSNTYEHSGQCGRYKKPNFGTIRLSRHFTPDPQIYRGTSGGSIRASEVSSNCSGWISRNPDHTMILRKSFDFLRIFVESSSDITLVVRMPNGDYRCNDDTYGTNPALDGWWPSGRYQIWIGSYKEGEMPSYILKLTEHKNITPNGSGSNGSSKQSPNFGTIRLSRNFTPDPKIYRGTSGGSIRASGLSSNCSGWISRAPDHVMILLNSFDFLRIFAESSSDITLVVRMPNGDYRCNDDTYGTNPALDGRWSSGRYQIWIGSYKEGEMPSYILKLTEHKNITPHRSDSSSPSDLKSNFGTIQLSPHFSPDPKVYQGRSGGSIRASGISSNCSGWITSTPDHILILRNSFDFLRILAESLTDITLVVRMPNGEYRCNDDTYGTNPALDGRWPSGTYRIWIGSYKEDEIASYTLKFTEYKSTRP